MTYEHVWMMIEQRELAALKAIIPSDFDFRTELHPDYEISPLQFLVDRMAGANCSAERQATLEMALWLLERGADALAT
eukprot:1649976-Prymnesium_polylepis.1